MARLLNASWSERLRFASLALWGAGALANEAIALFGLALCAAWFALEALPRSARALARAARAWAPLWIFIAWCLAAPALDGRFPTATGAARLLDWAALPIAGAAVAGLDQRRARALCAVLASVFLLSCAVAAFQHYGLWPRPEAFARLAWTRIPFWRVYEPAPAPGRFMAGGLLAHRLKFAHVGGLAVVYAASLGAREEGRWRILGLSTSALGAAAVIAFPYARAATAALLVALPVAVVLSLPWRRAALWIGAAVALALFLAAALDPALRSRFEGALSSGGSGDRDAILASGVAAVRAHPWVGLGVGQFRPSRFAPPNTPQYVLDNPGKAHNQVLSQAAETGVLGALLLLVLLAWLASSVRPDHPVGAAALASLALFAVLALFHDPLIQAPFSLGLMLAVGAGLGVARRAQGSESTRR